MKGLIFKEFLDFVEQTISYEMVDKIIMKCNLRSGGAYTIIGTYDPKELFQLVEALSHEINIPTNQLLLKYGEYMFGRFVIRYPYFLEKKTTTFQFLVSVENRIHMEVKKFYTDAELPHFQCHQESPDQFTMIYQSSRPLADFAEGLIRGCIHYHGEDIELFRENIPIKKGTKVKFSLIRRTSNERT